MYNLFSINLEMYEKIIELAKKNGKQPGDSMEEELIEIMKQHPDQIKHLGQTDKDVDMLTGDMREQGKKVINMNEINRKKDLDK